MRENETPVKPEGWAFFWGGGGGGEVWVEFGVYCFWVK